MLYRMLAGAMFLTIGAAQAGDVTVSLKGLDLSDPAAKSALVERIQAAAEQACGSANTADNRASAIIEARDRHQDCVRHAARTAWAEIQAQPRLARAASVTGQGAR